MKRKLYPTPTHARAAAQRPNRTKARARLALLLVAALAVAYAAVSTTSLAQTKRKKPARTQPSLGKLLHSETTQEPGRESSVAVPKKNAAEKPSAGKGAGRRARQEEQDGDLREERERREGRDDTLRTERAEGRPRELRLRRGRPFNGDVRQLPQTKPVKAERPEREGPEPNPVFIDAPGGKAAPEGAEAKAPVENLSAPAAQAPAPNVNFEGLDFNTWGLGHPPDTVGDVGPNHYVQSINASVAIYDKATGTRIAAFTLNTFMSQGAFGNLCDTANFGDPVVLYDTFEDRWVITDFAFQSNAGNVVNPPGMFQCFAVSKTGDPVAGGWNFYSVNTAGGFGDYGKFSVWPDGLYMSVNMFGYANGAAYLGPRVYAFNKAQMYAGSATAQSVTFDGPSADFTILPSNARLQTGTPPPGTPNYFLSTWRFTNALTVYKFKVDWEHTANSTFTGPDIPGTGSSWPNASVPNAPSLGGNALETLPVRAMMQNQYTNMGGVESLWAIHTVRRGDTSGFAAPRFYQLQVTGGVVAALATQAATFDPDGANVIHRFAPSLAVDRAGNMAFGYSTSSSTTKPAIKYAGRLSTDPAGTFSQTEQTLIQGAGTQTGNCGGAVCTRWGDYAAMSLDPDGCTFWFTNMYYAADGLDHRTRIGSFNLPQCTPAVNGGIQGNVTSTSGGGPVAGATIALGTRTTTTDAAGFYSFPNLPAGTYPSITASFPGYTSSSAASVVVSEGGVTVQNFALSPGADSACLTDTTLADFQTGVPTDVDLTTSPGNVLLQSGGSLDQQSLSITSGGFGFNATSWVGQTFTPTASGHLTKADLALFCSGCTGTTPNLTVSVRATAADLPTGPDLATATVAGFNSGAATYYSANFASPATLTAGTRYALVVRPAANPSAGTYAYVISSTNIYGNGRWVISSNSGLTWAGAATGTPSTARDLGFRTFIKTGTGTLVSSLKDANPHIGGAVSWTTLSWNAVTPAGTSVKFQVAASNSPLGPFVFVGPDGTAGTFYTATGASLSQFNGKRYLKYKAVLTAALGGPSPTLGDVTVCFNNTVPTTLSVAPATGTFGGTVNLSATLTDGVSPLAGKTVSFTLNGNGVGSAVTDGSGVASLANASLAGINAGSYPTGVGAAFAAAAPYLASGATNALTVNKADATVNVVGYTGVYDGNPHGASGTATGVNGEDLSSLLDFGATYTNAPGGTAHWTFNSGGANGNYNSAAGDVGIVITQAGAMLVWANPADIVYGTPLGATQLNAVAAVPGTFVYAPGAGTVLNAGNGQTLHVDFTPTDTVNYSPASADVGINVLRAPLTVRADDKAKALGAPLPMFTATYSGFVNGDGPGSLSGTLVFTTPATAASPVGTYPIVPGGVSSTNYDITFVNGTLTIGFNVCPDYDQTQAKQSGSTVPVRLRLCDASGGNQSSASVAVQAVSVVNALTSAVQSLDDAGNANPGNYFRFDGGGYVLNLKTTGFAPGTYTLAFTVAGDPTPHTVQFVVK